MFYAMYHKNEHKSAGAKGTPKMLVKLAIDVA